MAQTVTPGVEAFPRVGEDRVGFEAAQQEADFLP